ncbi:CMRF35-like molecule 9 isoform X4 [Diceros bicornis minor]|uniref:CMRF35-like molecule 9 isoform X4 n=1 Tax=Diceros bicornis minor TaxID=77932 RepID=UPI0026F1F615|nr:CMRF35-like molecule 9 isoform X4 [Diceros bicornis minor]
MRPLVLLWGCLVLPGYGALKGPKEVRGFEGDTVSLQCTYGEKLRERKKYWCREKRILISHCSGTIYAEEDGQERTEGRVSIRDSPQELKLTVTMRNLTLQDTGKYWCGAERLGFDWTSLVSLLVFPGPCCPASPRPSFQPLATTSLQPKAKAWQTQPPELRTSHPATELDSTSAEDASLVPSSSSSKSRVSTPMVHILAPVLVLLSLLLAAGLAALGNYMLRWRKEAQLVTETQRNEKVHLSDSPLQNGGVPEYTVINLAGPTGPHASPKPSSSPCTEIRCLSQTSEEDEASLHDPEGDTIPGLPCHVSEEELGFSKFVSV